MNKYCPEQKTIIANGSQVLRMALEKLSGNLTGKKETRG